VSLEDALVTFTLEVEGPAARLSHRGWVGEESATLVVGVRPGEDREITVPPAFLTAALVRLTRMRPRRPDDDGAEFRWLLAATGPTGSVRVEATDGPGGLRLADQPVSNTEAYRILSTLLPSLAG
jgi:hypothetical protein